MKRFLLSAFLLLSALAALAQGSLEVVPLQHRSAEQVMPILRPLLDPGAALTGQYRCGPRYCAGQRRQPWR